MPPGMDSNWRRRLDLLRLSAEAKCALGKNRKSRAQLLSVPVERQGYQFGLHVWVQTRQPDQQDSRMKQTLPEYKLPKILVGG